MVLRMLLGVAVICAAGHPDVADGAPADVAVSARIPLTTTTYSASPDELANPERGFFNQDLGCADHELDEDRLANARREDNITLFRCVFYLDEFKDKRISRGQIDRLERHAVAARNAGIKLVLRFAYTDQDKKHLADYAADVPLARVLQHLDQLASAIRTNADVIAVVEAGFVGLWGEGGISRHFGNYPNLSASNWADRKALLSRWLEILPADRKVLVRTPLQKRDPFGFFPSTETDSAVGNPRGRVGHFNDCFLATPTDMGTYSSDPEDLERDKTYLEQDSQFVPMGGETCEVFVPRSECETAKIELDRFHWTYLNDDYDPLVLQRWIDEGCMPEVKRRLGYRFVLRSTVSVPTVRQGGILPFRMTIGNAGWAGPINRRPVWLVLRKSPPRKTVHRFYLGTAQNWRPDAPQTRTCQLRVPSKLATGGYQMLLSLPDADSSLGKRPEYAIQLANAGGLWEPLTGLNRLLRAVTVRPQGPQLPGGRDGTSPGLRRPVTCSDTPAPSKPTG